MSDITIPLVCVASISCQDHNMPILPGKFLMPKGPHTEIIDASMFTCKEPFGIINNVGKSRSFRRARIASHCLWNPVFFLHMNDPEVIVEPFR